MPPSETRAFRVPARDIRQSFMAADSLILFGGPTAIRTRVTSSASSCDIQATLWVQRLLHGRVRLNPDGWNHIERGRSVFQLGCASFFDFGPVIG